MSGKGGYVPSQTAQMHTWMREPLMTIAFESQVTIHVHHALPGLMALKAISTMKVFAKIAEIATETTTPKTACLKTQVTFLGWSMNINEQKKQSIRETSRI